MSKANSPFLRCAECGKTSEFLLVDEQGQPGLEFCSWAHLMLYAIKKHNQEVSGTYTSNIGVSTQPVWEIVSDA